VFGTAAAFGQTFPTKPLRIITAVIKSDTVEWDKVIKDLGIRAD
jgi:hypothetical protein